MVSNLKPKVASVVSDQLPEFINDSYPNFTRFLEAYYTWIETNGNPLGFVRNINEQHDYDTADEMFKTLIENNILSNLPSALIVDKALLVKNIKDIFRTKGTEASFQFLLNALYGEEASLGWGKDTYTKLSETEFTREQTLTIRRPRVTATARIFQGKVVDVEMINNDPGFLTVPEITFSRISDDIDIPDIDYHLHGSITSANVMSGGYGYTTATVTVSGARDLSGQAAVVTANILNGEVSSFNIANYGSKYKEKPILTITGDGTGATASVEWSAVLGEVEIIDGGIGWTTAPKISFIGGTGTKTVYKSGLDIDGLPGIVSVTVPNRVANVIFNLNTAGTITSATIINPGEGYQYKPTIRWDIQPSADAKAIVKINNGQISSIEIKEGGTNYTEPPSVTFTAFDYDYFKLIGNRITQQGTVFASAVVDNVTSYIVDEEEYFVLTLQKKGIRGTFIPGSVLSGNDNIAIVTPMFTSVDIRNAGSGYLKGNIIHFDDDGIGGRLTVEHTSRGSVDELIIANPGSKYVVGDEIVAAGNAVGTNFLGKVTHVDGIGAKADVVMGIDEAKILDNGYGYTLNDEIYIYGGAQFDPKANNKLARLRVSQIISSNDYKGANIISGGSGYQYVSLAILPDSGSSTALRIIRPDGTAFKWTGSYVSQTETLVKSVVNGAIKTVTWTMEDPDLGDSSVTMIVNGANALLSGTFSAGALSATITVTDSGVNYVDPVVSVTTAAGLPSAGSGGEVKLTMGAQGQILTATRISAGSGYANDDVLVVSERAGKYANIAPILKDGGIGSLTLIDSGEFTEVDKYGKYKYTIVSTGTGLGLELDLYYKPVKVNVTDTGKYYTDYTVVSSEGHGSGAILWPVISGGVITRVDVKYGGAHYHYDCILEIVANTGSNAILTPVIEDGILKSVTVVAGGTGYPANTAVNLIYSTSTIDPDPYPSLLVGVSAAPDNYFRMISNVQTAVTSVSYKVDNVVGEATVAGDTSPLWPLSSGGIVNTMFQFVDFVDIWPQDVDFPNEAEYVVSSEEYGKIIEVKLTSPGTGYFSDDERIPLTMTVVGDGTGAMVRPVLKDGGFIEVVILDGGQEYTSAQILLSGGQTSGTTATFNITIDNGVITYVTIVEGGTGYYYGTRAVISGDGVGASVEVEIDTGITKVDIVDGGSLYGDNITSVINNVTTSIIDLSVTDDPPTDVSPGTGAVLKGIAIDGVITEIQIINPGVNYHNPLVTVNSINGSGAVISAFAERPIKNIKVVSPGTKYVNASLSIYGDGTGAAASVTVSKNSLNGIHIPYAGNRYSRKPSLSIVDNSGYGAISEATIINPGFGYDEFPTLVVNSQNSVDGSITKTATDAAENGFEITLSDVSGVEVGMQINDTSGNNVIQSLSFITNIVSNVLTLNKTLLANINNNTQVKIINEPKAAGGEVVSFSKSIGKVNSVRFDEFSIGETYIPLVRFPIRGIVSENVSFYANEMVFVEGAVYPDNDYTNGPHATVNSIDYDKNMITLVDATENFIISTESGFSIIMEGETANTIDGNYVVHEASFKIAPGDVLVGAKSQSKCKLLQMNRASGYGVLGGVGNGPIKTTLMQGAVNDSKYKMHDNKRHQDFSYIISTGISKSEYEKFIDKNLHLAGYSMWGNIALNTTLQSKMKLPLTTTGQAIYDLIVLDLTMQMGYLPKSFYQQWRTENTTIASMLNQSIEATELYVANGFETNTTWPAERTYALSITGSSYVLSGTTLTVTTLSAHGLVIGDKVKLDFLTGGGISNIYYVTDINAGANTFTVDTTGKKYIARYESTGGVTSTSITVYSKLYTGVDANGDHVLISHKLAANDVITATKISPTTSLISGPDVNNNSNGNGLPEDWPACAYYVSSGTISGGSYVNGSQTIASIASNSFTFTNGAVNNGGSGVNTSGYMEFYPTTTSGTVTIQKITSRQYGGTTYKPWKTGTTYNMGDWVELSHNELFYAKTEHISDGSNKPLGVSSEWILRENLQRTDLVL